MDLLTEGSWSGVYLSDVAARLMAPFEAGQITFGGPVLELSPKQALALSPACTNRPRMK